MIVTGYKPKETYRKEMKHIDMPLCDQRWEDLEIGKKTYINHNRKTNGEYLVENRMQRKK